MSDFLDSLQNNLAGLMEDNSIPSKDKVVSIKFEDIETLEQVRTNNNIGFSMEENDDSLVSLANSIRFTGLKQPITVRPKHVDDDFSKPVIEGKYILVMGERRFRASQLVRKLQEHDKELGQLADNEEIKDSINCIVKDYENNYSIILDQLTENIHRTNLTSFEQAFAYKKIFEEFKKQFPEQLKPNGELKSDFLVKALGKSKSWISMMRTFIDCPVELLNYFSRNVISPSLKTGYDLICCYNQDRETTINMLNQMINEEKVELIERAHVLRILSVIKDFRNQQIQKELNESNIDPNNSYEQIDQFVAEQQKNTEIDEEEPLSDDDLDLDNEETSDEENSTETENTADDTEYTESAEREHSDKPKMFAKEQESTAPTAGVNATSSYTDRDTRAERDLSDGIEYAEDHQQNYDNNDSDTVDDEVYLTFYDEQGNTQKGVISKADMEEIKVQLICNGELIRVPLSKLKFS